MKPIKFPQDEQNHKCIIEWWYWNGHLQDKKGNQYSFMNCLFQADPEKAKIPLLKAPLRRLYFSHSIVSDIKRKKSYPIVNYLSLVSRDSFKRPLLFVDYISPGMFDGYTVSEIEETGNFKYRLRAENFDLRLESVKKPLLEGRNGYLNLGSRSTYYYSLTNLKTKGTIKIGGREIEVKGKSWMDHQWANAPYSKDKWTWFSVQLKNNTELICFEYESSGERTFLAGLVRPDGRTEYSDNVRLTPLGEAWMSPRTKARYQLSWRIEIVDFKMALEVQPLIKNQEIVFGTLNYWEGPLSVKGEINGKKVSGQGFLELVGRPSKYKALKFFGETLEQTIKEAKKAAVKLHFWPKF
jgi:predicted secreted hydrolase